MESAPLSRGCDLQYLCNVKAWVLSCYMVFKVVQHVRIQAASDWLPGCSGHPCKDSSCWWLCDIFLAASKLATRKDGSYALSSWLLLCFPSLAIRCSGCVRYPWPPASWPPGSGKAKWRVCGERGSAKIAYTKLVHQKYLPRSSAKVSGISLQSVLLLAHHSTNCPRIALGSTNVPRLPRC